mmetsp:Transcript_61830/g.143893  ORF Transcript_61830/g.143893 Transcript_61830/m.143893 type:complete len:83 (-) Transcript_61830:237-485(-)
MHFKATYLSFRHSSCQAGLHTHDRTQLMTIVDLRLGKMQIVRSMMNYFVVIIGLQPRQVRRMKKKLYTMMLTGLQWWRMQKN